MRICAVADGDLGAFKAKLWNLRKLGVIKSQKVGSGSRESFSINDAVALRLALELNAIGLKPTIAVKLTQDALRYPFAFDTREEGAGRDVFLFVEFLPFMAEKYWPAMAEGETEVAKRAKQTNAASYFVVNISCLVREMTAALNG